MKYIDGFRNPAAAMAIRGQIDAWGRTLAAAGRRVAVMEVCGSHTMAIARYGIRDLLPEGVSLISGPGCPVCVTPTQYVDAAVELAARGMTIVTFGDMLHVPGSKTTLAACRSQRSNSFSFALRSSPKRRRSILTIVQGMRSSSATPASLTASALLVR